MSPVPFPSSRPAALSLALAAALLLGAAALTCVSCNGGYSTPAEQLKAAQDAMNDQDFEEALALYTGLFDWSGDGTPSPEQRFRAAFQAVICRVELDRFEEAAASFKDMKETFPEMMQAPDAHKKCLTVIGALSSPDKQAFDEAIDLLEFAKSEYPKYQEDFQKLVEQMKKAGLSSEQLDKLKGLGYI